MKLKIIEKRNKHVFNFSTSSAKAVQTRGVPILFQDEDLGSSNVMRV